MIRNYFKVAWRNLRKNRLFALINIIGLAAGLAACLLIGVYIRHELSYDRFHKNADRIVRATMEYTQAGYKNTTATTGTKVGPQFKRIFPSVEEYARTYVARRVVRNGEKVFEEPGVLYADESFFRMFSFPIVEGNGATALDAPDKVVITRSAARKYFGNAEPLNQALRIGDLELRVAAVCADVPDDSQIGFDFVTPFENLGNGVRQETWWTANWITYFLLRNKDDIPAFEKQVDAYMRTKEVRTEARLEGNDYLTYHMEPLTRVHLYSTLVGFTPNGNITYIYVIGVIALLILAIACANYTNLATAQSASRGAEIGMRKVMGASRKQVFRQFVGESALVSLLGAALALLTAIILVPWFNKVSGKQFTAQTLLQPEIIGGLIVLALAVGLFAGLYPALILSGTQVMKVLKNGFTFTGNRHLLRKSLIVVQFGISFFLIIYTATIYRQVQYMQTKNLGYDREHIAVLPISGKMLSGFQELKDAFTRVPGVEAVTASYETPEFVQWGDGITAVDEKGTHEVSLRAMPVDLDFARTLKMKFVAGRDFLESDFGMMDTSGNYANYRQPYIINEALAREIGWKPEDAINKTIDKGAPGPVVGVVKDFNFSSLREPVGPLLLFLGRDFSRNFLVRINGNDTRATLDRLAMVWQERVPERPFSWHFLDEDYNRLYQSEQRSAGLFGVSAGLAILLACLGLFGLAAFAAIQRTREIGIRRVLGASAGSIAGLFAGSFVPLIGIAFLVAAPIAWVTGNRWLRDFAYRINLPWWVFAAAGVLVLFIAVATVSFHALKASLTSPVKSLRTE